MKSMLLSIPGHPFAQQRHRHTKGKNGNIWTYDPLAREKAIVKQTIQNEMKEDCGSFEMFEFPDIYFRFYMKIPKYMSQIDKKVAQTERLRHIKKPDCDNICKFYQDCLSGILFKDDNCVKILGISKHYSEMPRVEIEIFEGLLIEDVRESSLHDFQYCVICEKPQTDPNPIPTFSESPIY